MDDSGDPRIPQDGADLVQAWLGEHAEAGDADPVREYLKQVSKVPGLTAEQEAELARSGGRRESHPPAPTDPGVTVSRHRALVVLVTRVWPSMPSDLSR